MSTYEDIRDKAEWEGGLDEALDWFEPEEVPSEIQLLWASAKLAKKHLEYSLDLLHNHFPED